MIQPQQRLHDGAGQVTSPAVLIIDDDPDIRDMIALVVQRLGLTPLTASNGAEGLAIFIQNHARIACVLLDLNMPVMSGHETLPRLQAIVGGVNVLLMSGFTPTTIFVEAGCDTVRFLQKPFSLVELRTLIGAMLPNQA